MLSVISISEQDKWDRIVRSFQKYDVYYLSGYAKAFQAHGDGEPVLFYYEDGSLRAINAAIKRDVSANSHFSGILKPEEYYDLITPYGYGGFLVECEYNNISLEALNSEYTAYCADHHIVSEYARFHPVLKNGEQMTGMYEIEDLGKTVLVELDSPESIWRHFSSKNRNMVRKSQKSGVEIFWGRSPELIRSFAELYRLTLAKINADHYYYFENPFYDCFLYELKDNCMLFYAVYQEKIIAESMILHGNQQLHYHLSASDERYRHLAPNNLLLYEAACWGSQNNFKTFHLGGGLHSREDSLFHFKSAFQTGPGTKYSIGKKCFHQEAYGKLVSIRAEKNAFDPHSLFFPLYRQ